MEHPRDSSTRARRGRRALVLTAVAEGPTQEGGSTGGGDDGRRPRANDINPVDRDELADGGDLRWAAHRDPAELQLPPARRHAATTPATSSSALMPSAVHLRRRVDRRRVNKDYLESAELTANEPKQVITYKINPKAVWSDGTPITVADFEAQWKALERHEQGLPDLLDQRLRPDRERREGRRRPRGDRHLQAALRRLEGPVLAALPGVDQQRPEVFNDGLDRQDPLTTAGPFKFESIDETAKTITLVRNDKWWGDAAKLDRIIFRVIAGRRPDRRPAQR